jgi:hypothetical protein
MQHAPDHGGLTPNGNNTVGGIDGHLGPTAQNHNARVESAWRRGEISDQNFDWWLRWMCGV